MQLISRFILLALGAATVLSLSAFAQDATKPKSSNSVVAYLRGAELQKETNLQRAEIRRALRDMLHEEPGDPGWLQRRRYADYQGRANQWPITTLLQEYFVPTPRAVLNEKTFFEDLKSPEAQTEVRAWIKRLEDAPALVSQTCPAPLKASETLETPKGWELRPGKPDRFPQTLALYDGHPSELASLVPDNGDETSDFYFWSGLDPKRTYWITCGYGNGAPELAKALPPGFTYCEAPWGTSRLRIACYAGP